MLTSVTKRLIIRRSSEIQQPQPVSAGVNFAISSYGRARDVREICAQREDRRDQERQPRPDQMGTDGVPGNPEFRRELFPIDFAGVARACGIAGYALSDRAQCAAVLRNALATPGPALIEAAVDPNEPPLPPKSDVRADQESGLSAGGGNAGCWPDRAQYRTRQDPRADMRPRY